MHIRVYAYDYSFQPLGVWLRVALRECVERLVYVWLLGAGAVLLSTHQRSVLNLKRP
jgi:hypothetical protein